MSIKSGQAGINGIYGVICDTVTTYGSLSLDTIWHQALKHIIKGTFGGSFQNSSQYGTQYITLPKHQGLC